MKTKTWQLALVLILGGLTVGVQTADAQSPVADLGVTVHVRNYAGVDSKTLADAERVAAGIFRKAGIESRWVVDAGEMSEDQSENSADDTSSGFSDFRLHILSPEMAGRLGQPSNVMGLAPGTGPDRRYMYVFYSSVKELAQKQVSAHAKGDVSRPATLDQILGEMMAHEIGHLLLNLPSHTETGIMRGYWDMKDLSDVAYGSLLFTPQQSEVIRADVARRSSQQQRAAEVANLASER